MADKIDEVNQLKETSKELDLTIENKKKLFKVQLYKLLALADMVVF